MAKRKGYKRSRNSYRRGNYKFTPRRRQALLAAQKKSARNRRIKYAAAATVGVLGVAGGAYLGHRYGGAAVSAVRNYKPQMANARNAIAARLAVQPGAKEAVRKAEAISPPKRGRRTNVAKPPTKRTVVPAEDPASVRARDTPYRPPGHHQQYTESGDIVDKTDKYLPRELVKGRKIKQETINKALAKDSSGRAAASGMGRTTAEENDIINSMIADGTVRSRVTRGKKAKRKIKRPKKEATHGGLTESQWRDALAFEEGPRQPLSSEGHPASMMVKPGQSMTAEQRLYHSLMSS